MDNEKEVKCDATCCARDLVLLYEGEEFRNYLEHHVANYQQYKRGVKISLREVESSSSSSNVFEHGTSFTGAGLLEHINGITDTGSSSSPLWDGVLFPAHMTGALQESNRLWDWNDYLLQQHNSENDKHDSRFSIQWMDIHPFFRTQAQLVDNNSTARGSSSFLWKSTDDRKANSVTRRTLYAPLDGDVISLYYRKDLFEKHQIQVPRTWDGYRDVASFFHGKPWGPNNSILTGSCVAREARNSNVNMDAYWASLVLSTMTQTKGTSSGFLLDPETIEPILGDAMEETLRILAQELALSEGSDKTINDDGNSDNSNELPGPSWTLNEGSCAMTFSWAKLLTTSMNDDYEKLNNMGVAPTPGSKFVLNRTSGRLETCTPELCPYGTYYDDIGIVNRPSYSAFGGWAGGVSNDSTSSKQHEMADFFSYLSNPMQSLSDVLPNERSHFVSPYRYSHTKASNLVGLGLDDVTASQYTETIKEVNSENTVSEIRISPGAAIREIIDQEVNAYLLTSNGFQDSSLEYSQSFQDAALRSEITANMDRKIRDAITAVDTQAVIKDYQSSLSFPEGYEDLSMNYIDINYRDTGWGIATLICFTSFAVIIWILWNRRKPVMQAFQPILLIQSAVGIFVMGATLFPLGFDDSLFSENVLDVTCMATPWIYVFGYTVFLSSIYSKIQVGTEIFKNPGKYERLMVMPMNSFKLFCKLFLFNGVLLSLWTFLDPLKWSRIEMTTYGSTFPDGSVESYGSCKSEKFRYPGFAIALYVFNLVCSFLAMFQALRCRFLVLEYREMQWVQLCILPFFEAWIIGGPVIAILHEQPTARFVAFLIIIASSSIASASALFAPKEWYIRKYNIMANENELETPSAPPQPGVRVLKHPKLESQKHVSNLQNRLVRYTTSNTELAIDIRVLQEKFRLLTEKEKLAVVGGMFARQMSESTFTPIRTTMFEEDEPSASDTRDSDVLAMAIHDLRRGNNQIDTIIAKHPTNNRVSELSIDFDDLNQFRDEAGKLYSHHDDHGPFEGKSVRSIVGLLESVSGNSFALTENTNEERSSEVTPPNRQQQNTSPRVHNTIESVEEGNEKEPYHASNPEAPGSESASSCSDNKKCDEVKDGNQMIQSDSIQEVNSEISGMEEEAKASSSSSENVSDLQHGASERVGEDLNILIESDNIRDLQSETWMIAEQFKLNNTFLESISDLKPCVSESVGNNSTHDVAPDVSDATATSTSSVITDVGSKDSAMAPDTIVGLSTQSTAVSSAGESSRGHKLFTEEIRDKESEGNWMQQHAGQPSSDCRSSSKSTEDIAADTVGDDKNIDSLNPLVPMRHEHPKTPLTAFGATSPLHSSVSSAPSSVPSPAGLDSPFNASQSSSNNINKTSSLSIDGWQPSARMGILLADLSDSASASSRAESMTDSISSMEIAPTHTHSKVRMGKDIEELLNYHGFDAVKVEAEKYGDCTTDEQNEESNVSKISTTRQRKRELEAKRLSILRFHQKDAQNP